MRHSRYLVPLVGATFDVCSITVTNLTGIALILPPGAGTVKKGCIYIALKKPSGAHLSRAARHVFGVTKKRRMSFGDRFVSYLSLRFNQGISANSGTWKLSGSIGRDAA